MSKGKKITLIVVIITMILLIIPTLTVTIMWKDEISTINSIKVLSHSEEETYTGPVYEIDVKGDYYFDKFVKQGGVSNDQELIDFIVGNITKGLIPINLEAPEIGCAAFSAQDNDGNRLFGRNYDFSPARTSMILKTNPEKGRYTSISTVDLGFLGIEPGSYLSGFMQEVLCLAAAYIPLDGINDQGLSVGILMTTQGDNDNPTVATDQQDPNKENYTSTTMLRYMLDYCATVDEAVEFAKSVNLHDSASTSFHYMIADANGDSVVLEWVPEGGTDKTDNDGSKRVLKVIRNDDDAHIDTDAGLNDFQYVTNYILTPGYYDCGSAKPGEDRYLMIENKINPNGTNTDGVINGMEAGLDVLKYVGRRRMTAEAGGTDDNNSLTVWSAMFDLTNKKLTWVGNEKFGDDNYTFSYQLNSKGIFVRV